MARKGKGTVALLRDESFLWGVMAYRALAAAGLPFRLLSARQLKRQMPEDCAALFVPGGWASNKLKAIGKDGAARIRDFVAAGGAYIGFCGGAGMAVQEGLGLVDVRRKPTKERVPAFSGPVRLVVNNDTLWQGIADPVFHAWWPSQLEVGRDVSVAAVYGEALPGAFSSDINVGDAVAAGGWQTLEASYGINLDPERMKGEPAVIRGTFGQGTVLLSLIHFDSPQDPNGATVLRNVWEEVAGTGMEGAARRQTRPRKEAVPLAAIRPSLAALAGTMKQSVDSLIDLGTRNFLWFPRNSLVLQWRRGVRGLEYCTLKVLMDEIEGIVASRPGYPLPAAGAQGTEALAALAEEGLARACEGLLPFVDEARILLVLERQAMARERLTFEESGEPRIRAVRERLFSNAKSHGGLFKRVIDDLDSVLSSLLA